MAIGITSQMRTQVSQLYVALFGRAPDGAGNDAGLGFWSNQLASGHTVADVANTMFATAPARAYYPSYLTNQEIIASFYQNVLGRTADAEGLAYWTGKLNAASATPGSVIAELIDVVANYSGSDPAGLQSKALFNNRVEVAQYYGEHNGSVDGATSALVGVTSDHATVVAAIAAIDAGGVGTDTPEVLRLTIGDDTLNGSALADTIVGRIGTADGVEANSLNSGDIIDGGALTDTLTAQVMPGAAQQGTEIRPIQPLISNVENIKIEAQYRDITESNNPDVVDLFLSNQHDLDGHTGHDGMTAADGAVPVFNYNVDDTYIRAVEISDHKELWSYNSTGDLILQDVTTLTSGGLVRNTSDLTIGMAYTGNGDSHWDESDYKVYFDQDYLSPRQLNQGSTMYFELMDMDSALTGGNPLETNPFGAIVFKIGGVEHTLTFGTNARTYVQLLTDVQAALAADPAFANLTAAIGPKFTATDTDTDPGGSTQGDTIVITNHGPEELEATGVLATRLLPPDTDYHKQFTNLPPGTENIPVEINVALEKVGDSGDGGELVIGSMNKGEFDGNSLDGIDVNTYNDTTEGFEKFNVTVYGDSEKPSSLAKLRSTNNTLETVIVKSEARTDGSYADLIIGNSNTGDVDAALAAAVVGGGGILTDFYGLRDVKTWDSTAFLGDATLYAGLTGEMSAKYGNTQYDVNYNFGIGSDSLHLDIDENGNQALNVNVAMGEGDDSADVHIDGDSVDAVTESFEIDLGNGDNSLFVSIDREMQDDWAVGANNSTGNDNGLSLETTDLLKNLSITSGSGVDTVEVKGLGNFDIQVGADSDFVFINAEGYPGVLSLGDQVPPGGPDGSNPFGWSLPAWETAFSDVPANGVDRAVNSVYGHGTHGIALYNAKLSVRYAGFESTVNINTGPDFIATTQELNQAVIAAIAANPELARLIEAEVGTTDQDLIVRSLIDGNNPAELIIFQPELVAANATGSQVVVGATNVNALAAALIATGRAENSSVVDAGNGSDVAGDHVFTAADIAAFFTDTQAANLNEYGYGWGPLTSGGANDGLNGTYLYIATNTFGSEGCGINDSVINMGTGANDLVVLSSNDESSNTLVFDAAWGKVSVVNWFVNEETDLANGGASVGNNTTMLPTPTSDTTGDQTSNGSHLLDFTAFLTNTQSSSGSPASATPIKIEVYNATGNLGGTEFSANNIVFANLDDIEEAGSANLSFGTLTAAQVAAALDAAGGFGAADQGTNGVDLQTGNPIANAVVETTRTSLLFVQNVDADGTIKAETTPLDQEIIANVAGTNYNNYGDYKVYQVTYATGTNTLTSAIDSGFTVTLLGQIDFGNSLDLTQLDTMESASLVGGNTVL